MKSLTNKPITLRPFKPSHIRPRPVEFQFDPTIPKLWFCGSSITTHLLNGTNLFLPAFEGYMVRAMQSQIPYLQDAPLRSQLGGLLGQELHHSQAHQQYLEVLRQQGYRFEAYLGGITYFFNCVMPRLGMGFQLATIAGFEHMTASLAEISLHHNILEQMHPTMQALWEWHAAEELEHKEVAFDLFQARGGAYWQRVMGGVLGVFVVIGLMMAGMLLLAAQDAKFLSFKTLSDLNQLLFTKYRLILRSLQRIIPYFHPRFHPSQVDTHSFGEKAIARLTRAEGR
jgi:predicted metal-dependent hydrolase